MIRKLLKSKIHRATVTEANIDYEGSVTIDGSLLELADIKEFEGVCIWDLTNGARIETYAITGKPGSGTICVNGAGAHLIKKGDQVIIASYGYYADDTSKTHRPEIIFVDNENNIKKGRED